MVRNHPKNGPFNQVLCHLCVLELYQLDSYLDSMVTTNHVWFLIIEGTFNPNYGNFLGFDGPSLILILVFGVSKKFSFCSFLTKLKFGPI
jgi:hypothetical protein